MIYLIIIIAALCAAAFRTGYKLCFREHPEVVVLSAAQTIAALLTLPLLYFYYPTTPVPWLLLITQAFLWTAFVYFDIRSLKHLDLGLASILGSSEYVVQLFVSVLVFSEHFSVTRILGAAIILFGIVVAAEWKKPEFKKGFGFQLLSVLCIIIVLPIDAVLARELNPWFVGAFAYLGPTALLLIWNFAQRREILRLAFAPGYGMAAGLLNGTQYLLTLYLFTQLQYSQTVSSFQLSMAFSLLLGWWVLKENQNISRRMFAALLVFVGVGLFILK